jgi:hypothetical protein
MRGFILCSFFVAAGRLPYLLILPQAAAGCTGSKASRDEVDEPAAERQHSNHVNQDAEKKGSEENRQPLKLPGEGRVKESRHRTNRADRGNRSEDETDDEKSTHVDLFVVSIVGLVVVG